MNAARRKLSTPQQFQPPSRARYVEKVRKPKRTSTWRLPGTSGVGVERVEVRGSRARTSADGETILRCCRDTFYHQPFRKLNNEPEPRRFAFVFGGRHKSPVVLCVADFGWLVCFVSITLWKCFVLTGIPTFPIFTTRWTVWWWPPQHRTLCVCVGSPCIAFFSWRQPHRKPPSLLATFGYPGRNCYFEDTFCFRSNSGSQLIVGWKEMKFMYVRQLQHNLMLLLIEFSKLLADGCLRY